MFARFATATILSALLAASAQAGPTLYSAPLRVDDDNEIVCRIRNVGKKDIVVQLVIGRMFDGVEVEVGPEETVAPGRGTSRGALANASSSACEFRLIKGRRNQVRASASLQGPSPDRTTFAVIEAR